MPNHWSMLEQYSAIALNDDNKHFLQHRLQSPVLFFSLRNCIFRFLKYYRFSFISEYANISRRIMVQGYRICHTTTDASTLYTVKAVLTKRRMIDIHILQNRVVCKIKYGKDHKHLANGKIPVYGSGGIMRYADTAIYTKKSILIPRKGTLNNLFFVSTPFWSVDTMFYTEINETIVMPEYLYYQLLTLNLAEMNVGTAVPSLTTVILNDININLPPLTEQIEIGLTLSALDNKIATNTAINHNLEQIAQAIFKSWFVDFEPWGGVMPSEWREGTLSELIAIRYGKDHKKLNYGSIPVFGSGGIMRFVDTALYNGESVLIPRKGTLNNVFYVNQPFWSVDTMFYTEMKFRHIAKFIYFVMRSKDLVSMNAGSAVPSMTTEILNSLEIIIPTNEILKQFDDLVDIQFRQMQQNEKENNILAAIRDALLPKLMSGEIEIS